MTYYVTCDLSRSPNEKEAQILPQNAGVWVGRVKKTIDAEDRMTAFEIGKAAIERDTRGTFDPWNFGIVSAEFADKEDADVYANMHECNRLFILRNWRGMTQKQLAEAAGIPIRTIQKYENRETNMKNMTIGMAQKIAAALNVTIEDLI